MESAFFYNTFFTVSPIVSAEPTVSALPDDVLTHISKFINPKLDLIERYKKITKKLDHWTLKPVEDYLAEAEQWGYKETPKCYKGNGKIYKKTNRAHLIQLKTAIWDKITEKGFRLRDALYKKWDDMFWPPQSPVKLPNFKYQYITGKISERAYYLSQINADGTEVWTSGPASYHIGNL